MSYKIYNTAFTTLAYFDRKDEIGTRLAALHLERKSTVKLVLHTMLHQCILELEHKSVILKLKSLLALIFETNYNFQI